MKLITGWLLARGIAPANSENPTETQVLEAIQRLHTSTTADVTALGNEKQTLSGALTALTGERDTLRRRQEETTTALANEQTARAAERRGRAELAVHRLSDWQYRLPPQDASFGKSPWASHPEPDVGVDAVVL